MIEFGEWYCMNPNSSVASSFGVDYFDMCDITHRVC